MTLRTQHVWVVARIISTPGSEQSCRFGSDVFSGALHGAWQRDRLGAQLLKAIQQSPLSMTWMIRCWNDVPFST